MKQEIIEKIEQYDTIIIHRHVRPDEDAYGSQLGLASLLRTNYPHKMIYTTGLHSAPLDYLGKPTGVDDAAYEGALVIVTDTANTDRVDDHRYTTGAYLIKIDHHPNEDKYGDMRWVNTDASSCSEMIFDLAKTAEWTLTAESARYLFAGIVGDTGRFQYPSTTELTFNTVAELIDYDFDRSALFNGMYEVSCNVLQLQGYIYQNFSMDENGAGYIKLTKELLAQFDVTVEETNNLVPSLGNAKGIVAWAMFVEEDDQIRIRLRSKGPVINTIAKQFRGGGHPVAAGATIYDWSEADDVIQAIEALCKQQ